MDKYEYKVRADEIKELIAQGDYVQAAEIADTIDEIKSTCNCGRKTIVNARTDSRGNIITEGQQVEIGGNERYVAVCRKCWRNRRIEQARRSALPLD